MKLYVSYIITNSCHSFIHDIFNVVRTNFNNRMVTLFGYG